MLAIRKLVVSDIESLQAHLTRHRLENGQPIWYMPYDDLDPAWASRVGERVSAAIGRSLSEPGWMRMWILCDCDRVVGHADLTGGGLPAALHRCELGIGLERGVRAAGWGKRLMLECMTWAEGQPTLAWLDLRVFANNLPAIRLYESLGFSEVGRIADCFRLGGESIDDVQMTRALAVNGRTG